MNNDSGASPYRWWSLPALPILICALLVLREELVRSETVIYDPPYLLPLLNFLFLFACPLLAGIIAAKGYLASGARSLLLLVCGLFVFSLGSLAAGFLLPEHGPNAVVTMHNSAVLLAGAMHLWGAIQVLMGLPAEPEVRRRRALLLVATAAIVTYLGVITWGILQGFMPVFFVQGLGPTGVRQAILGAATLSFVFAGIMFLQLHSRIGGQFLYWYATALLLVATGLGCVFLQTSVGSPIGWIGRMAQYLSGLYLVMAVWRSAREFQVDFLRLDRFLAKFFRNQFEALLEERTAQLVSINEKLRKTDADLAHAQTIAHVGNWSWDIQNDAVTWSPEMYEIYGVTPETFKHTVKAVNRLIHPDDLPTQLRAIEAFLAGATFSPYEYRVIRPDGATRVVHVFSVEVERNAAGQSLRALGAVQDITDRKQADQDREVSIELLRRINASESAEELAGQIVQLLQERLDCQAVGIRFRQDHEYPYLASRGFAPEFVAAEGRLCQGGCDAEGRPNLACLCGGVIRGAPSPAACILTEHGSFWSNDASEWLEKNPELKSLVRGRCIDDGYRSIALVPLRFGGENTGLMQVNDRRPGRLSAERVVFLERMAGKLAIAFARFRTQESLRKSEEKYRDLAESIRDVVWVLDPQTMRFLHTSPSVRQLRGYTPEEVMAMPIEAALTPQSAPYLREIIRQGVADFLSGKEPPEKTYTREVELSRKDGTTVWTEVVASVYINDQTGRLEVRGVSRDISERKAAEAEAARHQAAVAHLARLSTMGQMSTGLAHELIRITLDLRAGRCRHRRT